MSSIVPIDYTSYRSKAFNSRVRFLVLHYTAVDFQTSVNLLSSRASAHYLVPALADDSYISAGFDRLQAFNLVDEKERAWHAGISHWQGFHNLNDSSIGIEIVNLASDDNGVFTFPEYEDGQVELIIQLASSILQRYPDIEPCNVLAHSDIAPFRKSDPGPRFPWKQLHDAGIGAWYDDEVKSRYMASFEQQGLPDGDAIRSALSAYGYAIAEDASDQALSLVTRAFQLHFRPDDYSGRLDIETIATLYALNDKYRA